MARNAKAEKEAEEYRAKADALAELASELLDVDDSIAEECPVLSEFFHEIRTSKRRARDGRIVALFDHSDSEGWICRSVSFLEQGTHYRDTGADLSLSYNPMPFLGVDQFARQMRREIKRQEQATLQTATGIEEKIRARKQREQYEGSE